MLALVICALLRAAAPNVSDAQTGSISHDGRERTFLVHLPPAYSANPDTSFSLILAFHGGFGSSDQLPVQSQLSVKADTARFPFVVVYPDGVPSVLGIRTWNAGTCCGFSRDNDIDDVGFVGALLDTLLVRYRIDRLRIYATGLSNGGMLSYRLGAEMSDRFAAVAPIAASLVVKNELDMAFPVPLIHFQSFLDTNVPLEGGVGDGFSRQNNPPADSSETAWAIQNGCDGTSQVLFDDPVQYLYQRWTSCGARTLVELYATYDGGHSWPGGKSTITGDPVSEFIVANDLMWQFFLDNPRSAMPTGIGSASNLPPHELKLAVYPNPTDGRVTFEFEVDQSRGFSLEIFDILGRVVTRFSRQSAPAGIHRAVWDGLDSAGQRVPSGVYLYRLQSIQKEKTGQIVISR